MASAKEFLAKHGLAIGTPTQIVFNSSGTLQAAALSGATISITSVDIDGGTDIGADLVDADLLLVDDGAGGTNRKSELSRVKKYIYSAVSGDATVSDTGALTIAATSVENSMLAGSIANSKLTNSTVSLGGVSIALGASDATPAFDLSDATNYPTSSLSGTITNAQLAGSIANDKLSNSTVSFGGVSLALGASDATPAFDLSDATNYPTSSLSGTITNTQLAGSIANSKLTNSTITVTDGSNSTATALGGTITFAGTANETTVSESSGTVTVGLPDNVTLASNLNVGKNVVISGNLTVSGTQTIIDTNTLNIGDNIITLNSDETGTPSQNAGIEVERGTGTNVVLRWNETTDKWQFTNDGSSYEDIGAGITVQDEGSALSTAATTLNFVGSAVTATGTGATKTITIAGGDIVNDTTPQLGGNLDTNSSNINFSDNSKANFGAGNDLQIYHDGTNSYIQDAGTGDLIITTPASNILRVRSDDLMLNNASNNAHILRARHADGVELYYSGSQKFVTTNTGINVTGNIVVSGTVDGVDVATLSTSVSGKLSDVVDDTSPQLGGDLDLNSNSIIGSGHIDIGDNNRLKLGASDDLQIYHDGSHSYIDETGTGYLILKSSEIQIQSDGGEDMAKFEPDGSVRLYHNNVEKITTTSGGITVAGNIVVSGTVDGVDIAALNTTASGKLANIVEDTTPQLGGDLASNGNNINIADSDLIQIGTGNDLQIYHQSDVSYFKSTNASAPIRFQAPGGEVMANFIPDGAVELYHNGSKKLETTSDGVIVTGRITTSAENWFNGGLNANTAQISSSGKIFGNKVQIKNLDIKNPDIGTVYHEYIVTVATKTSAHPYAGQGSSNAYFLDSIESPSIILAPNQTYRFDQANGSNSGHPLRFYLEADKTTAYTTGVTTNGTAGNSGAYTQIVVTDATPPVLYYQCSSHGYMGSVASSLTEGTTDHLTEGTTNLYYTNARVDTHLNSGSASSGQILSWNGSDYAWVADQTGGGGSSLTVQDEGSALSTAATTLNFVGAGVTASGTGATKTITISGGGGGSSLSVKDEGSALSTAATTLNFVGAGVTASGTGAEKTITISGGTAGTQAYTPQPVYAQLGLTSNHTVGSSYTAITTFNTRIKDTSTGNALTSTLGDGKFIIPSGVSKIRLRASVWCDDVAGQVIVQFWKNGAIVAGTTSLDVETTGGEFPVAFTRILDVAQNDFFQVAIYGADAGTVNTNYQSRTWFELEVVEGSILGGLGNLSTLQDVHNASPTDGQALVWDNSNSYWAPGTVGAAITVQDEGSSLSTSATTLNFVGSGVTASGTGATKTITISGGGGSGSATNFGGEFGVYTGNGSTTTFTSPLSTSHANNIIVSVDGLMQRPTTDYTISGTTVTFGTAPPAGTTVMIRSFSGELNTKASVNVQNFTGNGSNTVYKLVESVSNANDVLVTINGIFQRPGSDYTYNTGTSNITFDEAPTLNDVISFRTFDVQARQGASATVSDSAPSNPRDGDLWFDSSSAKLYMRYEDGSSNQWVSLSIAGKDGSDGATGATGAAGADGSATVYANTSVLPTSGNSVGDFAFATLTKSVHVWDGTEWDRISSGGDEIPTLTTTPASTHSLNSNGTNTAITIVASDPDGFPITYSHDTNPASPNQVTNIVNNNGVFTLVPSTNTAHAGNFTLRLKASDGVSIKSHSIAVSLSFNTTFTFNTAESVINSNYTADNKVEVVVSASSQAATAQQSGRLGKGYIEFKMIDIFSTLMVGVQVGTFDNGYASSTGHYTYASNGGGYPGGYGATPGGSGGFTDNDIIMLAYDTEAGSNGQVWWGKNGTWRSGVVPGVNPGNDLGTDSSSVGLQPAFHNGSSSTQTAQVELISHTQGAQYTIPTGWQLA